MGDNTFGRDVPSANMGDHQVIDTTQIAMPLPRCFDLLHGPAEYYLKWGVPLHRAAMESDWKTAERILQQQPNLATAVVDDGALNVLHVACGANSSTYFIKQLVATYVTTPEDLALLSEERGTGLMYLAQSGNNVEAAKFMIEKNGSLPLMKDIAGDYPVTCAANWGHGKMASYLLSVTDLHQVPIADLFNLLKEAIHTDIYDLALEIVNMFPDLAFYQDDTYALRYLATKRRLKPHSPHEGWSWTKLISGRCEARQNKNMDDQSLELIEKLWGKVLRHGTKEDRELFCRAVLGAAENGYVELIVKVFRTYPPSIWSIDQNKRNIFFLAILNRQVEIFNLIYEFQGWKVGHLVDRDEEGNNALHTAAKMPPKESLNVVTGAALQMQRELLWFKEVENLVTPQAKVKLNNDKDTPHSLFTKNHEPLRKDGEKWMKATAGSCFVVAALVATIAFTSALTLPGGDDQNNGIPIFQRDPSFVTFAIADALSLVSSSIAIVMFLGILTSRYAQDDFLKSLPFKLLVGLSTLFFSIALMMVAFASTFFIIFKAKLPLTSIPAVVAILTTIPIGIFAYVQFPLLMDIYRSTYEAKYLFRNNHRIYKEKKNGGHGHFLKLKTLALNWLGRNN